MSNYNLIQWNEAFKNENSNRLNYSESFVFLDSGDVSIMPAINQIDVNFTFNLVKSRLSPELPTKELHPDHQLYEKLLEIEYSIEKAHKNVLVLAESTLKNYWTVPYSWFLRIIESLKSFQVKISCYENGLHLFKHVLLKKVIDSVESPYLLFGSICVAARTSFYLWNCIWNSAHARYPYTSFRIINEHLLMWNLLSKRLIRIFVREKVKTYLIKNKDAYTSLHTTVELLLKQIPKDFKKCFFRRF